jgi:Na+(H+)/acetate symporter ActP
MFVTFHVNVIVFQIFNLPHIYCIFLEMKILKIFTWFTNMAQTMWNHMVQYILNFRKIKV